MILRVTEFEYRGGHRLWLKFNDGTRGEADLFPLLSTGVVFEPLREPGVFRLASLDPIAGTIVWPNGADFAPEALHALLATVAVSA